MDYSDWASTTEECRNMCQETKNEARCLQVFLNSIWPLSFNWFWVFRISFWKSRKKIYFNYWKAQLFFLSLRTILHSLECTTLLIALAIMCFNVGSLHRILIGPQPEWICWAFAFARNILPVAGILMFDLLITLRVSESIF